MAKLTLGNIISGSQVVNVSAQGRLSDEEVAQCICNASVGSLSTRQLLEHFKLFQPDRPHTSFQAWAVEKGLWSTWTTKGGKIKPVGANERKAELATLGLAGNAEHRVLAQYDAIRVMFSADKDVAERIHKMDMTTTEVPAEKPADKDKPGVPALPPLVASLQTVNETAAKRLNLLIGQVEIDESMTWIADELKAIRDSLKL